MDAICDSKNAEIKSANYIGMYLTLTFKTKLNSSTAIIDIFVTSKQALDLMTIEQYTKLSPEDKIEVTDLLQRASALAVQENFNLYMTFDKSAEPKGMSITSNILNNAVIKLTHQRAYDAYSDYPTKSPEQYREYYGQNGAWKKSLQYVSNNLEGLLIKVIENLAAQHPAFPPSEQLIHAINHAAGNDLYPPAL